MSIRFAGRIISPWQDARRDHQSGCPSGGSLSYREISIDEIPAGHPVRLFDAYWKSLPKTGNAPSRKDITPAGITASILRWMMVLEVVDIAGKTEFKYRLMGTGCVELCGMDYTGRLLGDRLTEAGTTARKSEFTRLMQDFTPIYTWSELPVPDRTFINVYRGVFPVTSSDGEVDQMFLVIARDDMR